MRIIDANKLIQTINVWREQLAETYGTNDEYVKCLGDVSDIIEKVPTIEERKTGRYIDAEELKHILNNSKYYGTTEGDAFADMIAECESIKERNKGKWSIEETNTYELSYGVTAYAPVYKCSACGRSIESHLMLDEPIVPEDANFSRFCPWCGAEMREEETDV